LGNDAVRTNRLAGRHAIHGEGRRQRSRRRRRG
jgi:hypothetical protein